MNAIIGTAFVLGLAGSAHCIGMCGPIALAVPSPKNTWNARLASTLILNSGRVTTYMLLGVAFGLFGFGVRLAGLQKSVSVIAGILLILSLLIPGILERIPLNGRLAIWVSRSRNVLARNLKRTSPEALFLTGMLNGLLPCGLVYAAAIGASAMGSVVDAVLFMALFGVGTLPALILVRMGGSSIGPRARSVLRRASPVLVSALAVLLILRGLELNIPFISPPALTSPNVISACH